MGARIKRWLGRALTWLGENNGPYYTGNGWVTPYGDYIPGPEDDDAPQPPGE